MELKAEYRRETYRNYVIFENGEDNNSESIRDEIYEIPMLLNNKIPYLLNVQITYLNERAKYAYDITSNQAIFDWVERRKIKNKDCEHLYSSVFGAIDACSEYLLDESKLVFSPEYIYYDLGKDRYRFVYHVYYHRDILSQVNDLSEFLMDHIDYEDERAVLLVYAMYHESKRKEASIDTLVTVFREKKKSKEGQTLEKSQRLDGTQSLDGTRSLDGDQKLDGNGSLDGNQNSYEDLPSKACETIDKSKWNKVINTNKGNNDIKKEVKQEQKLCDYEIAEKEKIVELTRKQLIKRPIMESRQESERLVSKYPIQSYSVVGVTLLVMLIVIVYSITQGLEPKKLVAVILIVASITAYIGSKMFNPKKKVEKMIPIVEYVKQPETNVTNRLEYKMKIDNNKEFHMKDENKVNEIQIEGTRLRGGQDSDDLIYGNSNEYYNNGSDSNSIMNGEDDLYECTQLLSIVTESSDIDETSNNSPADNKISSTQYVLLPEDDTYKKLEIHEFPFYIGKITDGMDAVIMESTISRVHAKITQEYETFYITDMGSTNGTYINEENIQPHSKIQIKIGDMLRFANVSYIFANT